MNGDEFVETVREENRTALSRLGSSKALYADTLGEMEVEAVLQAAATAEDAAHETYETWAAEATGDAAEAWTATASEEQSHYEAVVDLLDEEPSLGDLPAIQAFLRDLDDPVVRAGGFLGRTLAAEKSKSQLTGFFVGQAKPRIAQQFRDMNEDLDAQLERALDLLADACDDDEDWERALAAASGAIQAAYDEYTERLNDMGVNPKPVC